MSTDPYMRLRETAAFRNGGLEVWRRALIGIVGAGTIGSRLAPEVVRSGASALVWDFDRAEPHNLATQNVRAGLSKVDGVVQACDEIRAGAVWGDCADIRRVGIGVPQKCAVLIDCTDDARLAYPLTEIANGIGRPLLRVAVDGSGEREFGRVLCSDPRDGGSCQVCTHTVDDWLALRPRTPCLGGEATSDREPTRAGSGIAGVIAGIALLQAQRLVTGTDVELVRDREILVDLSSFQILPAALRRSSACLSGHVTWDLVSVDESAITSLGDVYREAARLVGGAPFALEAYGHAWCLQAQCACGAGRAAVGTIWAPPPACTDCGAAMSWRTETQIGVLRERHADDLGLLDRSFASLGLPEQGAMFVVRAEGRPPVRMVLCNT